MGLAYVITNERPSPLALHISMCSTALWNCRAIPSRSPVADRKYDGMKTPQDLNGGPSPVCSKPDKQTPFQSECGNWDTSAPEQRRPRILAACGATSTGASCDPMG